MTTNTKPQLHAFQARVKPDNYIWLRQRAAEQERSLTWVLNQAIEAARKAASRGAQA